MLSSHWLGRHFVTGGQFNAGAAKIGVLVRVHRKMSSLVDSSTLSDPGFVSLALSQDQVHRIVASKTFQSAPTLQQLFRFLATRALEEHPEEMKEYTIGVEALGRRPDFDPKTDPIVRVQVYRLRQKLKEYYDLEGSRDSILVEIPKGHYLPRFEFTSPSPPDPAEAATEVPRLEAVKPRAVNSSLVDHRFRGRSAIIVGGLILAAFAAGLWGGHSLHRSRQIAVVNTSVRGPEAATDPVKAFWAPFVKQDPTPIIAYADAIFLVDGSADLFRFRHGASDERGAPVDLHLARQFASNPALVAKAGPLYYDNGYTGTGELVAAATLSSLFTQMGARPTIESSYDITAEDLKQHNVVLLGSPFQNVAVAQLPVNGDFVFVSPEVLHDLWQGRILNTHPRPGEKPVYQTERDPLNQSVKVDYAVISFQPGIVPGRQIANLGGLDTKGTEGAVLLATSRSGVEELSKELSPISSKDKPSAYQALLKVNLQKGYQVLNTRLLAVHPLETENARPAKHPASP